MPKELAIVLNNGSVNSAIVTALATQRFRPILLDFVGDAAATSRLNTAFEQQVAHFKPYRHHAISMPHLAMVHESATPQPPPDPRAPMQLAPQLISLLPMIATAARFAIHYQAVSIFCGLRIGSAGSAATDDLATASEYVQIWEEMIQMPCAQPDLRLEMPLLELDAWQMIDAGFQVSAPMDKTWSCHENTPDPCWACRGCRAREAAFQQAAKPDPLHVVRKV